MILAHSAWEGWQQSRGRQCHENMMMTFWDGVENQEKTLIGTENFNSKCVAVCEMPAMAKRQEIW